MYHFSRKFDVIFARHPDFNQAEFLEGKSDLPWALYEELYPFYASRMPYGTANGTDGDPFKFVVEMLREALR